MERRRPRLDPLLAEQVNTRLSYVLADRAPRRAEPSAEGEGYSATVPVLGPIQEGSTTTGTRTRELDTLDLGSVEDLPPPRRFSRTHVGVVAALLVLGLLGGGWSLLRARPVAVASPAGLVVSTPAPSRGPTTAATPTAPAQVVVHVLGDVRRPGLVTLPDRARVQDAINAAGGLKGGADPGELNLAQPLADGEQIVIGSRDRPAGEVRNGGASSAPGGPASAAPVDLNRATQAQLEELPGVGPVTATKIVGWRTEHSRFSRVEELQEVDGIGPKTYAQIAPHVRV